MNEVSQATKLIRSTAGRFFYCEFIKKDGSLRRMIARVGVKKFRKGEGLAYEPKQYDLIVVWDAQKKKYRMINLQTLAVLRCGEIVYDRREEWLAELERKSA